MSKRPELEIGQSVGALLVGGPLDGRNVPVRIGLNGLPHFLEFPDARHLRAEFGFPEFEFGPDDELRVKRPEFGTARYKLYDDVPAKYLHVDDWGDDDDTREPVPDPSPELLVC